MGELMVRPAGPGDAATVRRLLRQAWGDTVMVGHGVRYDATTLPALLAGRRGEPAGLLTYQLGPAELEVVTINSVHPGGGTGSALLAAATALASDRGLRRVWLVTTNDNLDALRFYQRRGMRIAAIHPGAVDDSRRVKPSIPLVGAYGIEIHDELLLEMRLPGPAANLPSGTV